MANIGKNGKFGKFGGMFIPETLITPLKTLEAEFLSALRDPQFQAEVEEVLREYVGRETPLYHARRLTGHFKKENGGDGPEIYLKREDLGYGGTDKINNAVAQAILARRLGATSILAATGSGTHGVAAAAACARLSLECTVFMGTNDIHRQPSNVVLMKLLGAQVKLVEGNFKDATSEAFKAWVNKLETSYYMSGTVVGPHPCPTMVREFQSVVGKETRRQAMEKWGGMPDVLIACIGSGSNAIGLFHDFVGDKDVRLIGVEGAGKGLETGLHSATLARGELGVYHGTMTYLLQDDDGQIVRPYSIAVGLEYPGVGPELSFLKDNGRIEFYSATDEEALHACRLLSTLEGIVPSLEASHALAFLEKLCPNLPSGTKVVVNVCGRGDKDASIVFNSKLTQ